MKQNALSQNGNRVRPGLVVITVLVALMSVSLAAPVSSSSAGAGASPAAPGPTLQGISRTWTALGSTGVVDEASLNIYAFGTTDIGFKAGAGSVVVARYNVTNTFDNNANPNKPGWRTLEMGSNAPINTIVEAKLFQVTSCSPDPVLLCTATNRSQDQPCAKCDINGPIDFTDNLYYVEVSLNRGNAHAAMPRMFTLRLL